MDPQMNFHQGIFPNAPPTLYSYDSCRVTYGGSQGDGPCPHQLLPVTTPFPNRDESLYAWSTGYTNAGVGADIVAGAGAHAAPAGSGYQNPRSYPDYPQNIILIEPQIPDDEDEQRHNGYSAQSPDPDHQWQPVTPASSSGASPGRRTHSLRPTANGHRLTKGHQQRRPHLRTPPSSGHAALISSTVGDDYYYNSESDAVPPSRRNNLATLPPSTRHHVAMADEIIRDVEYTIVGRRRHYQSDNN